MMIKFKVMLLAVAMASAAVAVARQCNDDRECFDGHFCATMSGYVCRLCLKCKDLQREEPAVTTACVRSITQCGPCLKDLVDSNTGDLKCVPREEGHSASSDSYKAWIIGAAIVILMVLFAALLAYWIRNPDVLKMYYTTAIGRTLPTHTAPTAPVAPPPYSPHWPDLPRTGEGTELPLIKTYQPPFPAQESQEHGRAGVFNPPAYVRLPNQHPPPQESYNDVNGNYSPGAGDDDTTPSAWVPASNNNLVPEMEVNGAGDHGSLPEGAAASGLSAALATARNTDLIQTPSRSLRLQESSDDEHSHRPGGGASSCPNGNGNNYNIMNVNVTIMKPLF